MSTTQKQLIPPPSCKPPLCHRAWRACLPEEQKCDLALFSAFKHVFRHLLITRQWRFASSSLPSVSRLPCSDILWLRGPVCSPSQTSESWGDSSIRAAKVDLPPRLSSSVSSSSTASPLLLSSNLLFPPTATEHSFPPFLQAQRLFVWIFINVRLGRAREWGRNCVETVATFYAPPASQPCVLPLLFDAKA